MNYNNTFLENTTIKEYLELYIQIIKLIDGKKELDEKSFNTLKDRYEKCFENIIEFKDINENFLKEISDRIENILTRKEHIQIVIDKLREKFNEQHNRFQTANTYNAIAYDNKSVMREIFQNIFDRQYDETILISMNFNDSENKVSIHYNEPGFDLKSLVFYFSAGDSAKDDTQTGKFGLGIKSVMYNVQNLFCESSFGDHYLSWYVEKEESYENKDEIKKKLELKRIDCNQNTLNYKGTKLSIELEKDEYNNIKNNFYKIDQFAADYLDIPELIFALSSSNSKELELKIDGDQTYKFCINEDKNNCEFTSDSKKLSFGLVRPNQTYIKELIYLNTEINQDMFNNCYSLYATYKMMEDRTLFGRMGNFFISVKNDYILSTRKALKNADSIKDNILDEAENYICSIANCEKNSDLFYVTIDDKLNVNYSIHLKKFMSFIKKPSLIRELFKNVNCPDKTISGIPINYYYHSAIAKVGHYLYSQTYRYSNRINYNSNTLFKHQQVNQDINFFIRKIDKLLDNSNINVIIDFFNANYDGESMDFSQINVIVRGAINDVNNNEIKKLVQLVYAPKVTFTDYCVYGDRGNSCYLKDLKYFKDNSIKKIFENYPSFYRILSKMNTKDDFELNQCYETLKVLCENSIRDVDATDYELFEKEEYAHLNKKFKEKIDIIRKENLQKLLRDSDVLFSQLLDIVSKNIDLEIDLEEVALNKKFDLSMYTSFKEKFLPKNQERLEKIVGANSNIEDFTESNIKSLLGNAYLCEKNFENSYDYFLIVDKNDQILKIKKETDIKTFIHKHLTQYIEFEDLDKDKRLICITKKKKRITSDIEQYIDAYLKTLGKNDKNLRGFSAINDIKTKTLHMDQLPQIIKISAKFKKSSLEYMEKEISYFLEKNSRDLKDEQKLYKALIYRDFSSELYGNGYCCSLKSCNFDVANEYAYDVLNLDFQNYKLPIFVCQNHKMILSDKQIHINKILIGDKDISEIFKYIDTLFEDSFIKPLYSNVLIQFTQKFNTDYFRPDLDSYSSDEDDEYTSEELIRLSPVNFALWYYLNRKKD